MAAMRRACRAAPLLALAATLIFLDNGRTSLFCAASGTPPSVGDHNTARQHELLRHEGRHPTTAAATGAAVADEEGEEEEEERHQAHPALSGSAHTKHGASTLVEEGDPASAAPEQVHIALAESGSLEEYAMTVAWATWPETRSQVAWGLSAEELSSLAEGSATTYSAQHPGRADYTSGFLHSATLEGLQPSTTYYYSCGDETLAMSSVRSFATPPKVGPEQAITLGILGDLGQTDDSAATLAAIDADKSLDLVLHVGDLSYADCDQPRWDSFMRLLDPVASRLPWMVSAGNHEIESGSFDGKPFVAFEHRFRMPASAPPSQGHTCGKGGGLYGLAGSGGGGGGSGDDDGDGDGACGEGLGADEADAAAVEVANALAAVGGGPAGKGVGAAVRASARAVRQTFGLAGGVVGGEGGEGGAGRAVGEEEEEEVLPTCCPSEWSGTYDYGNSFYSFDVGPVHVVVTNPYASSGENSEQYQWMQRDLESTDRTLTPWVVVMMHCPWYNSNLAHQGERQTETAMRAMEPLLHKHKIAVVIAGHVHAYERSHPVVDFELTEDGPTYLVVGGAGNREGHAAGFYSSPEWSAFRDGTVYGSGRLAIRSSSLALWEWTASGEVAGLHDVAWISNPFSPYTPGDTPRLDTGEGGAAAGFGGVGLSASDSVPPLSDQVGDGKGRVGGGLRVRRSRSRVAL